nr:unnamed protein product [Callosobruchus chinensis]CAH7719342.1 unnamed protein product [Callosobruchus chinensis]CAH7725501.1 unnamed protein product [Callosobruchus chinensis]CAH7727036.1 unnamed protein product [Callosobruchus chinensis]
MVALYCIQDIRSYTSRNPRWFFSKSLEKQVVAALENFPIVGVSPDGITDEFFIEVKCPFKNKKF